MSNIEVDMGENGEATLVAEFSPPPSEEWLTIFGERLKAKGFAFSEPLVGTKVAVYLSGQSGPVEAAIMESAEEANGS